jgi:6-phosphofructokinase 2
MNKIVTLTVNPAIDKSTSIASLQPNSKLRCAAPQYEAGGGGINVSRVIKILEGNSTAVYLAGGPTGEHLEKLLNDKKILQDVVPMNEWTRENLSVTDNSTNLQYRFGMPGSEVSEKEWTKAIEQLEIHLPGKDFLVASGSLAPGIPDDFYVKVASIAKKHHIKLILDTSGEALQKVAKSDVFLLKPNIAELAEICGVKSISALELEILAKDFLKNHPCEILVVSLGPKGAMLFTEKETEHIVAPTVHQKSTIGAGDSMVAGMVLSLANKKSYLEMLAYGVACGTATTMSPGTQLCKKEDVDKLYKWLLLNQILNKR